MYPVKQSTSLEVDFFAFDSNGDGTTGKATGDWTKRIKKSGGAWGALTITVTEGENGWYTMTLSSSHTDTLGVLSISLSASGVKRVNLQFRVHARIPDDLAFPTTSGRALDVTATGAAGIDWGNVENPTTTLALTGTTIATTQQVDVNTIKTNPVVNAGTITFPTGATLASTTNITAGTLTTVTTATNVTTVNDKTGYSLTQSFPSNFASLSITAGGVAKADLDTIKTQTVTCGAGVTVLASVGTASTSTAQTGDSFARIGSTGTGLTSLAPSATALSTATWTTARAGYLDNVNNATLAAAVFPTDPADASVIAARFDTVDTNIADVEGKVDDLETRLGTPTDLGSGASIAANLVDVESQTDDIGVAGAGLTAADNAIIAAIAALNNLSAAQVNTEVDTALADVGLTTTITGRIDAAISTRLASASYTAAPTVSQIWTTTLTEAYAAAGAEFSGSQALYEICQALTEFGVGATTVTVRKRDASTEAMTFTLDDAVTPTDRTRAS